MPIYEFKCPVCGVLEIKLTITDDRRRIKCPACPSSWARRQISRSQFQLKGRGWAKDGYK